MKAYSLIVVAFLFVQCATTSHGTVRQTTGGSDVFTRVGQVSGAVISASDVVSAAKTHIPAKGSRNSEINTAGRTVPTSVILNDGTLNWGNQNNSSYGNCLDVLSKTAMGLRDAERQPSRVDVIFVAANSSYQLWAPQYVKSDPAPEYTSKPVFNSVSRWNTVNESEIAQTRLTASQFDKIQTAAQIKNAVNAAPNFMSWITVFDKMDGQVFAVRNESNGRSAYALIKVNKQYGTDGSNGYMNVTVKSTR